MLLPLSKAHPKIIIDSSAVGGVPLSTSLPVGNSYVGLVLTGTAQMNGSTVPLTFADFNRVSVRENGDNIINFENGFLWKNYLAVNDFIKLESGGNAQASYQNVDNGFLFIPFYRNVKNPLDELLTTHDTGGNTGINNMSIEVNIKTHRNDANTNATKLTNVIVELQRFSRPNSGNNNRLSIQSFNHNIKNTGNFDINSIPRQGAIQQFIGIPYASAQSEIANIEYIELSINDVNILTQYSGTADKILQQCKGFRNAPLKTIIGTGSNAQRIDAENYFIIDQASGGDGTDPSGVTTAYPVQSAQSLNLRLKVKSFEDNASDADLGLIIQSILPPLN